MKTPNLHSAHRAALRAGLSEFVDLEDADAHAGIDKFRSKTIPKGEFFNQKNLICRNLAFVYQGIFRVYYHDPQTGEEVNLFFFREGQFMVSFKSFMSQTPCYYMIQALEDAEILQICHEDLHGLYQVSHAWERFGRVLAEQYFYFSQARTESFLFHSAEERYLQMITLYPDILQRIPLYHISSYLGIKGPSLSRIRKRISKE